MLQKLFILKDFYTYVELSKIYELTELLVFCIYFSACLCNFAIFFLPSVFYESPNPRFSFLFILEMLVIKTGTGDQTQGLAMY